MDFSQNSQNGVQPPTQLKTLTSNLGCAVSSTSTIAGRPIIVKTISNAAVYKESPANVYSSYTPSEDYNTVSTSTQTLTINFVGQSLVDVNVNGITIPGPVAFANISTVQPNDVITTSFGDVTVTSDIVSFGGYDNYILIPYTTAWQWKNSFSVIPTTVVLPVQTDIVVLAGDTTIIDLGPVDFVDASQAPLVLDGLPPGTHDIYTTWPGENMFAPISTENVPVTIEVNPGVELDGDLVVTVNPDDYTLIAGEGSLTLDIRLTSNTEVSGTFVAYVDNVQVGSIDIFLNYGQIIIPELTAGVHTIKVHWAGATIQDVDYAGKTALISYTVLAGSALEDTFSITTDKTLYIRNEGQFNLTAGFLSTQHISYPGNIKFYQDDVELANVAMENDRATYVVNNFNTLTNITFSAVYDGNQGNHPAYQTASSSTTVTIQDRADPPALNLNIPINPTAFRVNTSFIAQFDVNSTMTNYPSTLPGTVKFIVGTQVIGSAPVIENGTAPNGRKYFEAVFQTTSLPVGTYTSYAVYNGNAVEPKYYSTTSNSISLQVDDGIHIPTPMLLDIQNSSPIYKNQYIIGNTLTLTASVTTSTQLSDPSVFFDNAIPFSTSTWHNNVSTTTDYLATTGTHEIFAFWNGGEVNGIFYGAKRSAISTLTVVDHYLMPIQITNAVRIGQFNSGTVTVSSTLTNQKLSGVITLKEKVGNTSTVIATGSFTGTNQAVFGYDPNTLSTGTSTHIFQVDWEGQEANTVTNYLPFYSTSSNTSTQAITPGSLTLTASTSATYWSVNAPISFTATANTTTNVYPGTILFTANGSSFASTTIGSNGVATVTANSGTFSIGNLTDIRAVWQGSHPYVQSYYYKTLNWIAPSSTSATIALSTISYAKYVSVGIPNTNLPYATVRLYGTTGEHRPTGTLSLVNSATNAVMTSTTVTGAGTYTITWNPQLLSEFGDIQVKAVYSGDAWNYTSTTPTAPNIRIANYQSAPTNIILTANTSTITTNSNITLTATVTGENIDSAMNGQIVTFYDYSIESYPLAGPLAGQTVGTYFGRPEIKLTDYNTTGYPTRYVTSGSTVLATATIVNGVATASISGHKWFPTNRTLRASVSTMTNSYGLISLPAAANTVVTSTVPSGFRTVTDAQWTLTFPDLDSVDAVSITYEFTGTFWVDMGWVGQGYYQVPGESPPTNGTTGTGFSEVPSYGYGAQGPAPDHSGRWWAWDRDHELPILIETPVSNGNILTQNISLNTSTGYDNWILALTDSGSFADYGPEYNWQTTYGINGGTLYNGSTLTKSVTVNATTGTNFLQTYWLGTYKGTSTLAGLASTNPKYYDVRQVTDMNNQLYIYAFRGQEYDYPNHVLRQEGYRWCPLYEHSDSTYWPTANYFYIYETWWTAPLQLRTTETFVGPVNSVTRYNELNQLRSQHKIGFIISGFQGTEGGIAQNWYLGYDGIPVFGGPGTLPDNRKILSSRTNYVSGLKAKATATKADGSTVVTTNAVIVREAWYDGPGTPLPLPTFTIT